jgi:hypothetical protein
VSVSVTSMIARATPRVVAQQGTLPAKRVFSSYREAGGTLDVYYQVKQQHQLRHQPRSRNRCELHRMDDRCKLPN